MGEEVDRRTWLKVAGGTVAGLAIGAAVGYLGKPTPPPAGVVTETVRETVTQAAETVTTTVTETVGVGTPVPLPPVVGETVAERAINGVKELIKSGVVPAGAKVTVFTPSPLKMCHESTKEAWESATGTTLEISDVPMEELYEKTMLEAVSKTGMYDIFHTKPFWFGDLVGAELLYDITDFVRRYDPRMHGEPDGCGYPLDWMDAIWKGRYVGIPTDNDAQCAFYRKDLLEDPKEQDAFYSEYGYDLKPAETWEQFRDMAEFFTRPPDLYGYIANSSALYYSCPCFLSRCLQKKYPYMPPFDENMDPTFNTPEGIEAAKEQLDMIQFMPPGVTAWAIGEVYGSFASGMGFEGFNYPSFMKTQEAEGSAVKGNVIADLPPGTWVDSPKGKVLLRWATHGGGFLIAVSSYSKYPELAYLYMQYFCDPENMVIESTGAGSWMDPVRYSQMLDPRQIESHTASLMGKYKEITAVNLPYFPLTGGQEYITHLARNLVSMYEGSLTPEEAMAAIEKKFNEITDEIGRDKLIDEWAFMLETFYPKM